MATASGDEVERVTEKPFIKRHKNDAADAEAIVEAAQRPTMRFVEPKSAEQQARAVAFRTREQLVKQRTEAVNALRSHLYEFGHVAPEGIGYVPRQHSTGGKQKLGKTSKMGQRDIRRLLVIGATVVIRWASRRGAPKGSWLARMLERKPVPVVAVALANKMARHLGDADARRKLSWPGADRRLIRRRTALGTEL